jgi:uncharacterized protein YndB with AHSA1/START domain
VRGPSIEGGRVMSAVVECSVDISRHPEAVFSYATDLSRYPEWQPAVVSARAQHDFSPVVGSTAAVTRRVGPRTLPTTEEIVELDPPRAWAVRGVGGPFIAIAKGTIQPLDHAERSRVTLALEVDAHGIGKLLVPFAFRHARKQLPRNALGLRERLEGAD